MINSRDINELHPALNRAAGELIKRMAALGFDVLITSTYRDGEYQNFLYAQGRSAPGSIVTNARAGQSIHNYRLAFDICKNLRGHEYDDSAFFNEAGRIGKAMGLVWGGEFKGLVDKPHFEYTAGLSVAQLAAGKLVPQDCVLDYEKPRLVTPETVVILVDGRETYFERVLVDGFNYIKLRDLEKLGVEVGYDGDLKIPVLKT